MCRFFHIQIQTIFTDRPQTNDYTQKQNKQAKTRAGGKIVGEDDDGEEEALRSLLSLMILVFSG